jgi:hypothetical protein
VVAVVLLGAALCPSESSVVCGLFVICCAGYPHALYAFGRLIVRYKHCIVTLRM